MIRVSRIVDRPGRAGRVLLALVAMAAAVVLAGGAQGSIVAAAPKQAPADLDMQLDRLLSEHAAGGAVALMKQLDNAPDLPAAQMAVDQNAIDLSNLVTSLYGPDAGATFLANWRQHIQYYVQFTAGVAVGDQAMMAQADAGLNNVIQLMATQLSSLNPNLTPSQLVPMLRMHVDQTEAIVTSYAGGDYATTYVTMAAAMDHMFTLGDLLANAMTMQLGAT